MLKAIQVNGLHNVLEKETSQNSLGQDIVKQMLKDENLLASVASMSEQDTYQFIQRITGFNSRDLVFEYLHSRADIDYNSLSSKEIFIRALCSSVIDSSKDGAELIDNYKELFKAIGNSDLSEHNTSVLRVQYIKEALTKNTDPVLLKYIVKQLFKDPILLREYNNISSPGEIGVEKLLADLCEQTVILSESPKALLDNYRNAANSIEVSYLSTRQKADLKAKYLMQALAKDKDDVVLKHLTKNLLKDPNILESFNRISGSDITLQELFEQSISLSETPQELIDYYETVSSNISVSTLSTDQKSDLRVQYMLKAMYNDPTHIVATHFTKNLLQDKDLLASFNRTSGQNITIGNLCNRIILLSGSPKELVDNYKTVSTAIAESDLIVTDKAQLKEHYISQLLPKNINSTNKGRLTVKHKEVLQHIDDNTDIHVEMKNELKSKYILAYLKHDARNKMRTSVVRNVLDNTGLLVHFSKLHANDRAAFAKAVVDSGSVSNTLKAVNKLDVGIQKIILKDIKTYLQQNGIKHSFGAKKRLVDAVDKLFNIPSAKKKMSSREKFELAQKQSSTRKSGNLLYTLYQSIIKRGKSSESDEYETDHTPNSPKN